MPTSFTPPPKDDETKCGNCGAYIYHDLLKCPTCGAYLINPFPHIDLNEQPYPRSKSKLALWFESVVRKLRGEPHYAEELFTGALREAALFDDLLRKVGGDRSVVERLIEFERGQRPGATRLTCLQNAIRHWEQENM
jgi:rRNA maturation protein Nop10